MSPPPTIVPPSPPQPPENSSLFPSPPPPPAAPLLCYPRREEPTSRSNRNGKAAEEWRDGVCGGGKGDGAGVLDPAQARGGATQGVLEGARGPGLLRHHAHRCCRAPWRAPRPDPRRLRLLHRPRRTALRLLLRPPRRRPSAYGRTNRYAQYGMNRKGNRCRHRKAPQC
uniref:Uncharacterized protein n=1 Tax=Triticum urartu TaxID=4572 RepID=A0A8R7PFM0_TRIUA